MPAAAHDTDQRVLRERLAELYAYRTLMILSHLVHVIVAAVIIHQWRREAHVALAYAAVLAAADLYVLLSPRWHQGIPASQSKRWARRFAFQAALVSTLTIPAPWFVIAEGDRMLTTGVLVAITVSWTRAVQALSVMKLAMLSYGVPMMVGIVIILVLRGGNFHLLVAAIGTAHLLLTMRTGLRQNKVLTEALTLRFENEALARRLREQITETERASAEKTRFLATASHDLRQPLHAIALFGATLQNELQATPQTQNAQRLMSAVRALGQSLDTMLDVSRLDAGVIEPEFSPVSLDALFLTLNQVFAPHAEQKQLQLRVRASGLWVRSDPQQLHRMLANLVDNALKYTSAGGVLVRARARGPQVWIEVHDTGIGIAPEQLGRIFEEFYQVDNPGRDRSRGLGIGLSIVQRLARLLEHPVEVRSRVGRGTRFRLRIATAAPLPGGGRFAPRTAPFIPTPEALPRRVLLMDDEADIRTAMTGLLRSQGIQVQAVADEAAANAALADADARATPFDMLVCDYRLADGADGLHAALRLRERFGARLRVLLITGETAPQRLQSVRQSGIPVLFKPVDPARLLRSLAQAMAEPLQALSKCTMPAGRP